MATEQRVVSDKKKIGAKGGSDGDAVEEVAEKKSKKKLFIIGGAVAALAAAGGAYFFVLAPKAGASDAAAGTETVKVEQKPGPVVTIDSVSINLAGGHYLRLGIALQMTDAVGEETPETARALDLAIALFSQKTLEEVSDAGKRDALKAELLTQLEDAYEGEVMDLYFTDFVTQ